MKESADRLAAHLAAEISSFNSSAHSTTTAQIQQLMSDENTTKTPHLIQQHSSDSADRLAAHSRLAAH